MTKLPRGIRNNNPGNIRNSPETWQGEVKPSKDKEFKQFKSMAYGYRAMFKLLYNYQKRYGLKTIKGIIGRYAPSNENHTDSYIERVSRQTGIAPDQRIGTMAKSVMVPIVAAMSLVENGVSAVLSEVEAGWDLFIGK